ncbi:MAG: tyrosine-type recombinase/integrase [Solirubrobacterales bacterium]
MPGSRPSRRAEGVVVRHQLRCLCRTGEGCDCRPGYQAQVFSQRDRKTIRKTFRTLTDARAWRASTSSALRSGTLRAPTRTTLNEAAAEWLVAAGKQIARTRAGTPYKPAALRSYEGSLRVHVLPELGHLRLSAITRASIQDLADKLVARDLSPSTVRNALVPLRAIYRRAMARSEVLSNPTRGLTLPASAPTRERVAPPAEAKALLDAVSDRDRPIWATAVYAGLRRGELKALRWSDVDFERGVIHVERGWDDRVGPIDTKSRSGTRRVPLVRPLRSELAAHRLRSRADDEDLVFGSGPHKPINTTTLVERARTAWRRRGLKSILLHECRHTYASLMIAAGVNAKALSSYMGHSSITMTLDRYGHLLPGHEDEAAQMLEAFLAREAGGAR